jgi:outer membrane protein assembly factor BamB
MKPGSSRFVLAVPVLALAVALLALAVWWRTQDNVAVPERLPGADQAPDATAGGADPVLSGKLITGAGQAQDLPGDWPQFRGPGRDGISPQTNHLARNWGNGVPRQLWSVDCGEGYAGPAVRNGRVYLMDYDYDKKENALRCLALSDGREIWRYAYTMPVKRNHGMTRTVPAVSDRFAVAIDPKCNVLCVDAATGQFRWGIDLVREAGATIPPWYTGQCPLIDGASVILAPGGPDTLLGAVDIETGKWLWRATNAHDWKMTHSSVMPMTFAGRRFYVYCGSGGVAGISTTNGAVLWETTGWKISIATVPSPLPLDGGKIVLSGGYNAGAMLVQLEEQGGAIVPRVVWKLPAETFGATQHTPIFHDGRIFGTRPDGRFVSLGVDGKILWTTPAGGSFGLGPFMFADGVFLVMDDSGKLALVEDNGAEGRIASQAQILNGRESWAPMALAGNRLLARDFTRLVCMDLTPP